MTNSGEHTPMAPHRPLGKSADSEGSPTQPIQQASTGGEPPRHYGVGDIEQDRTGQVWPVPPAPDDSTGQAAPAQPAAAQPAARSVPGLAPDAPGSAAHVAPVAEPDPAQQAREKAAAKAERKASSRSPKQTRRARLRLTRVDPWSVTKTAFMLSIAFGIMCVVAVFLIFSVMSAAGLWDHVNDSIQVVVGQSGADAFDIKDYVGMSRVMGITMLISAIDVVILTALATLGTFIYNLSAAMLGGIEVTLAEDLK
ncbi:MAG: DUF3566 domain-containing protein [Nocardioidaceae bacterium]